MRATQVISFGPFRLNAAERLLEKEGAPVALSARALDILALLVARAGEVVGKRELIAAVWPEVLVDEGSLRFHINGLRSALGDGRDGARYISTISGRGYCFVAPVRVFDGAAARPDRSDAAAPKAALPSRLLRLIGRDEAVEEIAVRVLQDRFVTLVGPGGIGKTTVAVEVGHRLAGELGDARFVDLGSIADPSLVATMVASSLGFVAHTADLVPSLVSYLRDRSLLIVLDSCEHVVEAAARLAEQLFAGAPDVHILATSREALRVEGEHVHQLPPLGSPPGHRHVSSEEALAFPAVRLFVDRVAASGLRFELTEADTPAVTEICRSLDGIPLALELAAGRVSAFGVSGIAALLGHRFGELVNGRRTAIARHHTLGATLDWSYGLLTDGERALLRRLAVFVGPFPLEAAQAIAGFGGLDAAGVLEGIGNLVAKSLVAADFSGDKSCYRLLDTTKAYAREKLAEHGEAEETARRHVLHYVRLLEQGVAAPGAGASHNHLGNIRAGLEWCFGEGGSSGLGSTLAAAAAPLLVELSLLSECRNWAERGIAALGEGTLGTRREINLQAALGQSLMFTEGNSERVRAAFTRGVALARELDEPLMELRLLGALHLFNERIGNYHGAVEFAERSTVLAEGLDDPAARAAAGSFLGLSQHLVGNHLAARTRLEQALAQEADSLRAKTIHFGFDYRNRSRITLARHLWLVGEADAATALAERTIADAAVLRHPVTLCIALIWGITVFLWVGDAENSEDKIDRFLGNAKKHSLNPYNAVGLGYKGELAVLRGDGETGVALLLAALDTLHAARYELVTTTFMISLSQGLMASGRTDEALARIEETLALVKSNGDLLYLPEVLRTKGTILAHPAVGRAGAAEACFAAAIDLARRQSALAWELRAATSFARLRAGQNRLQEAHDLLAPVHDRFREGFATADLLAADALLRRTGRKVAGPGVAARPPLPTLP